ncbi:MULTISPECIES: NAD(P)/FAD-dependent oxidoreductase [Listeria]|uniref:phytoene desaturase family protein n=1 Tax=Listeria TaxID=1637 RepID=UPI00142D354B|nr:MULTISPECIES: phytoene desaturase family protein [Listeria]
MGAEQIVKKEKIAIIGAGPGGLAAGMRLSSAGYEVDIYEKNAFIGGRTSRLTLGDYKFDIGPSSITMPHTLTALFMESNRNLEDYVTLVPVEPMYKLFFNNGQTFSPYHDQLQTIRELNEHFPNNEKNYLRYMNENAKKSLYLAPLMMSSLSSLWDYFKPTMLRALPSLSLGRNLADETSRFFTDENLRLAFSFQVRNMGMSPSTTPGMYSIIPFSEFYYGLYHPIGGHSQLFKAISDVILENGGRIHLNAEVEHFSFHNKQIDGFTLKSGEHIQADKYIINTDYAYTMTELMHDTPPPKNLTKKKFSTSAFMIYLGLNKTFPLEHQSVIFPENYKQYEDELIHLKTLPEDFTVYVVNPSVSDTTMAPIGHTALRIMVLVPNNESQINWDKERQAFEQKVLSVVKERLHIPDLEEHIVEKKVLTPKEWENDFHLYQGAIHGLVRSIKQTGTGHPVHRLQKKFPNLFVVGTSAHPGTTLPYIIESANFVAEQIKKTKT